MLRYTTAGESHGPGLTAILEGIPAGLPLSQERIDADLARRQRGYGRGGRMRIEKDRARIVGGVRFGRTLGSPVAVLIPNIDFENWRTAMAVWGDAPSGTVARRVRRPRPGHADLAGALKYGTHDARDVLERASARETTMRVAVGAIAKALLAQIGVEVAAHTVAVGAVVVPHPDRILFGRIARLPESSPLRCAHPGSQRRMIVAIDAARRAKDTIGGAFQVIARGVPPGLGSMASADRRLDGRLAAAFMSIPAVKAVSIGAGLWGASQRGSRVHDEIYHRRGRGFYRLTNRAGGLEGGISTGEEIRITGYLKPLSTLARPLRSVDLVTKKAAIAAVERTDTIPILAAGVIGEAMMALVLADAALEKFGGDSAREMVRNYKGFRAQLARY
jgi:chorismate synthase